MRDLQQMSKAELLEEIKRLEAGSSDSATALLRHELSTFREETRIQQEHLRESQGQLQQSRDRFADLYEHAPLCYVTLDPKGVVLELNLTGTTMFEVERADILGHPLLSYVAADSRRKFLDHMANCRRDRGQVATEMNLQSRTGRVFPAHLFSRNSIADVDGAFSCRTAIIDMTQRRRADLALRAAREQLELTNITLVQRTTEAEGRALQLRALAAELSSAELRERRRLAEVLHDHLQQVLVAAKMQAHMAQHRTDYAANLQQVKELINQSIQISRSLTAELSPPVLYDADLAGAFHWLAQNKRDQCGMQVELTVGPDVEPVPEDIRVLLFAATSELLLNSAKHSGVLHARVSVRRISAGEVEVAVEDHGKGFVVAEFTKTAAHQDHFGLFSLRHRFEYIGGRVEIRSAPGLGATIRLVAPTNPAAPPQAPTPPGHASVSRDAAATARPSPSPNGKIRVLLADDHKLLREGLAGLLRGQDDLEIVGEASDGQAAVEMARSMGPDLVLMDVSMPRLGGVEATRIIRRELPDTKVIGLSMHDGPSMAQAMEEAGASAYLNKGCPSEDLIDAIRRCAVAQESPQRAN